MVFALLSILSISLYAQAAPVPDTGQTQSYTDTFGEDSDHTINPQSYTKLDEQGNALPDGVLSFAMVKDNVTGLIWEVKTNHGSIHGKDNSYNWQDAQNVFITQLNELNFGGYSDWRLPTVKELASIVNSGRYDPSINADYFPNTRSSRYWSSIIYTYNSDNSWYVDFDEGKVLFDNRLHPYYVRAVRGGQSSNAFVVNGDGTVTDSSTGLMWQQETAGRMTWENAISYCEDLVLAGWSDWRLPNRNEIQSIVDYATYFPAIDTIVFPGMVWDGVYWSSTTSASNSGYAWFVCFEIGAILNYYSKSHTYYVRAVRGSFDDSEICDGIDNDGDGEIDEGVLITYYFDEDDDGCGDPNRLEHGCMVPSGYVQNSIDCDDSDPNISPMKSITGESLENLAPGRHIFMDLAPSCESCTTYQLLRDFRTLGQTLNIQYKETNESPFNSTYWFFNKICGADININQDPSDGEVFVINRIQE